MKKIFLSIKLFFNRTFQNLLAFWRDKATIGIQVVNAIKDVVNSPVASYVVRLTSNKWDDELLERLRALLPVIAEKLLIADNIISTGKTQSEILYELIEYLRRQNKNIRNDFYLRLASMITQALADDKITFLEAMQIAQVVYDELYKK